MCASDFHNFCFAYEVLSSFIIKCIIFLRLLVPNLLLWIFLVSSPPSTSFVSEATKSFALAVHQVTNSMAHLRGGVFSVFWLVLVSKGFRHI